MPRPREPPTIDELYAAMEPGECYVAGDLRIEFEDEYDPSHNTIRNRLAELVESNRITRKEHVSGGVTYKRRE